MHLWLINCKDIERVLQALINLKYVCKNPYEAYTILADNINYQIFVDTSSKYYIIIVSTNLWTSIKAKYNNIKFYNTAEKALNDLNCLNNQNSHSFIDALKPGRIIEFLLGKEQLFGIVLESYTIVYITKQGQIKGYLNNYSINLPYKIVRIYQPDKVHYQLKDYKLMSVVWERPKEEKVKKSIADIEKELGLAPGTLEIL